MTDQKSMPTGIPLASLDEWDRRGLMPTGIELTPADRKPLDRLLADLRALREAEAACHREMMEGLERASAAWEAALLAAADGDEPERHPLDRNGGGGFSGERPEPDDHPSIYLDRDL